MTAAEAAPAALLLLPLALGSFARRAGILSENDGRVRGVRTCRGTAAPVATNKSPTHLLSPLPTPLRPQTAARLCSLVTLPSLILQAFNRTTPASLPLLALPLAVLALALTMATAWLAWNRRHPKERGLLAGSAVGGAVGLVALPFVQALAGWDGLRVALLAGAVNVLAVWAASLLLFGSAGAAFPESQVRRGADAAQPPPSLPCCAVSHDMAPPGPGHAPLCRVAAAPAATPGPHARPPLSAAPRAAGALGRGVLPGRVEGHAEGGFGRVHLPLGGALRG